jgi:replicative DNA helicase
MTRRDFLRSALVVGTVAPGIPLEKEACEEALVCPRRDTITGLPTGFIDLDNLCGGFQRGEYVVLAGPAGVGKSYLAMMIALNTILNNRQSALYCSQQMDCFREFLCPCCRIDISRMHNETLTRQEESLLDKGWTQLEEGGKAAIAIVSGDAGVLVEGVINEVPKYPYRLAIADALLPWDKHENNYVVPDGWKQQAGRSLVSLARKTGTTVLAVSQTPGLPEYAMDVDSNADCVMVLRRFGEAPGPDGARIREVEVFRKDHGPLGRARLRFHEWCGRFENAV